MERITRAVERTLQARLGQAFGESETANNMQGGGTPKIHRLNLSREALREQRIVGSDGTDEYSQAYKVLRTRVWHQMKIKGWQTIAITSANPGEGKTLTSINLAISLAMMEIDRTVILVDMDLRNPSVHRYFGISPAKSVADYLAGEAPLGKVLVEPGIVDRLVLLPGEKSIMNSSEMLSSPGIPRLLKELRTLFPSRLVIFDLPPMLVTDDALVLAPHVDAFLLVIEEGKSHRAEVSKAVDLLKDHNLLGTVLNKSQEGVHRYNYGYGY